ncbi:MAG: cyclic nucleotide-binding domain-containing protein [Pseudomonadota bacterium]
MFSPKFGTVQPYLKNQVIFKEGQIGNVGYLVKTGEVTIYKMIDKQKKVLSKLGPGEVFGEMGIVTHSPRTAFAEATEYCDLVVIDKDTLYSMLKQSPKLVQSITLLLMKRLSNTLDMLKSNEDLPTIKKMPGICNLLDLMVQYDQQIDYLLFCKKTMTITNATQRDLDIILQRLVELNAIEILPDSQDDSPSGWIIKVIDPKALPLSDK